MGNTSGTDWTLCLIADPDFAQGKNLADLVEQAVEAGATLVQLRVKERENKDFLTFASSLLPICQSNHIPFLINDRADIALEAGADGVHLGQKDMPLISARKLLGPEKLIGISVNTVKEAQVAEIHGADYLGVGPVFATLSKEDLGPVLGLSGLKIIRKQTKLPILAIGGINTSNVKEVKRTGVDGIAVISAILGAKDIASATKALLMRLSK